uniref:Uncharacterized protein n=1 Tax=Timema tahoe TaxID=61484 RepID=A0A7R9IKQ5_9NEOP|nr:unnamed protein product [Timema tahoe]
MNNTKRSDRTAATGDNSAFNDKYEPTESSTDTCCLLLHALFNPMANKDPVGEEELQVAEGSTAWVDFLSHSQLVEAIKKRGWVVPQDAELNWDKDLDFLSLAFNSAVHESTGCTPSSLLLGRELNHPLLAVWDVEPLVGATGWRPWELYIWRKRSRARVAAAYNRGRKPTNVLINDRVFCRDFPLSSGADRISAKLSPKWNGPWLVKAFLTPVTVLLEHCENEDRTRRAHVSEFTPCIRDANSCPKERMLHLIFCWWNLLAGLHCCTPGALSKLPAAKRISSSKAATHFFFLLDVFSGEEQISTHNLPSTQEYATVSVTSKEALILVLPVVDLCCPPVLLDVDLYCLSVLLAGLSISASGWVVYQCCWLLFLWLWVFYWLLLVFFSCRSAASYYLLRLYADMNPDHTLVNLKLLFLLNRLAAIVSHVLMCQWEAPFSPIGQGQAAMVPRSEASWSVAGYPTRVCLLFRRIKVNCQKSERAILSNILSLLYLPPRVTLPGLHVPPQLTLPRVPPPLTLPGLSPHLSPRLTLLGPSHQLFSYPYPHDPRDGCLNITSSRDSTSSRHQPVSPEADRTGIAIYLMSLLTSDKCRFSFQDEGWTDPVKTNYMIRNKACLAGQVEKEKDAAALHKEDCHRNY